MATNLQEYLTKQFENGAFAPSLFVHNRTLSKADPLVEKGATKAESIEGLLLASMSTIIGLVSACRSRVIDVHAMPLEHQGSAMPHTRTLHACA